jgi:hypothetical protein
VDLDQQFIGLQRGAWDVGEPDLGRLAIAFEGECFHVGSHCIGMRLLAAESLASSNDAMMMVIILDVKTLMMNIINV